jgi:hypothetical protein
VAQRTMSTMGRILRLSRLRHCIGCVPSMLLPPLPGRDTRARSLATGYPLLAPPAQGPSGVATLGISAMKVAPQGAWGPLSPTLSPWADRSINQHPMGKGDRGWFAFSLGPAPPERRIPIVPHPALLLPLRRVFRKRPVHSLGEPRDRRRPWRSRCAYANPRSSRVSSASALSLKSTRRGRRFRACSLACGRRSGRHRIGWWWRGRRSRRQLIRRGDRARAPERASTGSHRRSARRGTLKTLASATTLRTSDAPSRLPGFGVRFAFT